MAEANPAIEATATSAEAPTTTNPVWHGIDDETAKKVGWWITDTVTLKPIEMHVEIGRLIITYCYNDSLATWHEYNRGDNSLQKVVDWLHRLDQKDWNETRLVRSVGIYEQDKTFGPLFKRWRNLKTSHYFAVQPVPLDQQPPILEDADAKALTVEELVEVVAKVMGGKAHRRQKPTHLVEVYGIVEHLRRKVDDHEQLFVDLKELGMEEGFVKAFDGAFDRFKFDLEDMILTLTNMGVVIPEEQRQKFLKDRAERWGAAGKSTESGGQQPSTSPEQGK